MFIAFKFQGHRKQGRQLNLGNFVQRVDYAVIIVVSQPSS